MSRSLVTAALASVLLAIPAIVIGSEPVYLTLKANGQLVYGDSTSTSLGRANTIECISYDQRDGVVSGRRQYEPIVVRKRLDRSSPLLQRALAENAVVDGTFRFYRPNPKGDGTTEQFYTVTIGQGRIVSIRQFVSDVSIAGTGMLPPMEEVTFTFTTINWTYTLGGVSWQDTWTAQR